RAGGEPAQQAEEERGPPVAPYQHPRPEASRPHVPFVSGPARPGHGGAIRPPVGLPPPGGDVRGYEGAVPDHVDPEHRLDELRAASRNRRVLLDELTEVAASFTERPESVRASITATLDSASLDPEIQEQLTRGRMTAELSPPVRFFGEVDESSSPRRPARPSK